MPDYLYTISIISLVSALGSVMYLILSHGSFMKNRLIKAEKDECLKKITLSSSTHFFTRYTPEIRLSDIINKRHYISQALFLDWSEQIAGIFSKLRFLSPEDICISEKNRLKAAEPRESRNPNDRYAAPECFPPYQGTGRYDWLHDDREDVYRIGLILSELKSISYGDTGKRFNTVINRCLEIDSAKRYKNARKLKSVLSRLERSEYNTKWAVITRRAVHAFVCAMIITFSASLFSGYNIKSFSTPTLVLSKNESAQLMVERKSASGISEWIDIDILVSSSDNETVCINNGEIYGAGEGSAVINGLYRGVPVSVNVLVKQPESPPIDLEYAVIEDELVRVSQYYKQTSDIELYAGDIEALLTNDELPLREAVFASPESMAVSADGTVYLSDGEVLRIIKDGVVKKSDFEFNPHILRCKGNDLYILTKPYLDNDGRRCFMIIKLSENGEERLYVGDDSNSVTDFIIDNNNDIYLLLEKRLLSGTVLSKLKSGDETVEYLYTIPDIALSMDKGPDSKIYISAAYSGEILQYDENTNELMVFAGNRNDKAIIDGRDPRFYFPYRIKYYDSALFVMDSNVLRQISISDGKPDVTFTVAGAAGPEFSREINEIQSASSFVLPFSRNTDIIVKNKDILISDPKNRVIWKVSDAAPRTLL